VRASRMCRLPSESARYSLGVRGANCSAVHLTSMHGSDRTSAGMKGVSALSTRQAVDRVRCLTPELTPTRRADRRATLIMPPDNATCRIWGALQAARQARSLALSPHVVRIAATTHGHALPIVTHNAGNWQGIAHRDVRTASQPCTFASSPTTCPGDMIRGRNARSGPGCHHENRTGRSSQLPRHCRRRRR
jgi:hypothetical protein